MQNNYYAWSPSIRTAGYRKSSWTLHILWTLYYLCLLLREDIYCNDSKIAEYENIDPKTSSTACVIMHRLITLHVLDYNMEDGILVIEAGTSSPSYKKRVDG